MIAEHDFTSPLFFFEMIFYLFFFFFYYFYFCQLNLFDKFSLETTNNYNNNKQYTHKILILFIISIYTHIRINYIKLLSPFFFCLFFSLSFLSSPSNCQSKISSKTPSFFIFIFFFFYNRHTHTHPYTHFSPWQLG